MSNSLSQYLRLYAEHSREVAANAPEALNARRQAAYEQLENAQLPKKGDEGYPALSLDEMFAPDYGVNINRVPFAVDAAESFKCGVPNISTLMAFVVNDAFRPTASLQRNLPQGVTVASLAQMAKEHPDLIEKYYDTLASTASGKVVAGANAATRLNTLFAQDGIFVRVEKGVRLERPIQIVNIFNASMPLLAMRRLLIVVEDGAAASILLCDHTSGHGINYLSCQVAEAFVGEGASLEYYDLEESSASTARCAQLFARQERDSRFVANGTTLLGSASRNSYYVDMTGAGAEAKIGGMAIAADNQIVDNATCVLHKEPHGESTQMFKYILDDRAQGEFYGTIIVDEKAKKTNAYQTNRNILASAEARMHTRPQLEIYCDDVKCSHGATVGQLDANALFYMRQRGIPEHEAKRMLMQAFMADVIDTVSIPALKSRLQQLVERRLLGDHDLCATCNLQ